MNPQLQQFLWISAAVRVVGQVPNGALDTVEHVICFRRRILLRNVFHDFLKILRGVIGEKNGQTHSYRSGWRFRRRCKTLSAGWTRPCST